MGISIAHLVACFPFAMRALINVGLCASFTHGLVGPCSLSAPSMGPLSRATLSVCSLRQSGGPLSERPVLPPGAGRTSAPPTPAPGTSEGLGAAQPPAFPTAAFAGSHFKECFSFFFFPPERNIIYSFGGSVMNEKPLFFPAEAVTGDYLSLVLKPSPLTFTSAEGAGGVRLALRSAPGLWPRSAGGAKAVSSGRCGGGRRRDAGKGTSCSPSAVPRAENTPLIERRIFTEAEKA